jgi:PAS domain S-box-containing protein
MTTRTSHPPQIIYWRNRSPEADSLAETLRADAAEGQLNCVETPDQFMNALKHRTQLIVTHDPQLTKDVLKNVQCHCPDAVVVVVCEDESRIPPEVRDAVSHLLNPSQLAQLGPSLKRVVRHSTRVWTARDAQTRTCVDVLGMVCDAVIMESSEGVVSVWNRAAEKAFGWTDAEALGRRREEVLTVMKGPSEQSIAEALQSAGFWAGELEYRCKDGRTTPVLARRRVIRNGGGRTGMVEVCTDLSPVRRDEREASLLAELRAALRADGGVQEKLQQAARRLASLADACVIDLQNEDGSIERRAFEASAPALAEIAPDLRGDFPVFSSNRSTAADVLKNPQANVVSPVNDAAGLLGVTNPADKKRFDAASVQSALIAPVVHLEKPIGMITLLSVNESQIFGDADKRALSSAGAIVGAAFERARADQRVQAARTETQSATYLKEAFLGTVSHELRTPLQAMLGWTHLLREDHLSPADAERALNSLEDNIKAQGKIVNDLLEVSRINSGKLDLTVRPMELKPLIEQTLRSFETSADARQLKLKFKPGTKAIWVNADASWLQRAVWNLISNAVKFTPTGGSITVELGSKGDNAQMRVTDTGIGIDPKMMKHVFEYFGQVDSSTTRTHHGLGIGLAIARQVAEAHGGTVEGFSAGLNQGSTFTLILPCCAAPGRRASQTGAAGAQAAEAGAAGGETQLDGLRLLLVEDDTDTRELLSMALRQAGGEVTEAGTAAEALDAIRAKRFDMIVSDIGMSHEDGFSMMRKIRALPEEQGGHTPALALTAYASRDDRLNALRAGFQVHMPKPVDIGELLLMLKSLSASIRRT